MHSDKERKREMRVRPRESSRVSCEWGRRCHVEERDKRVKWGMGPIARKINNIKNIPLNIIKNNNVIIKYY